MYPIYIDFVQHILNYILILIKNSMGNLFTSQLYNDGDMTNSLVSYFEYEPSLTYDMDDMRYESFQRRLINKVLFYNLESSNDSNKYDNCSYESNISIYLLGMMIILTYSIMLYSIRCNQSTLILKRILAEIEEMKENHIKMSGQYYLEHKVVLKKIENLTNNFDKLLFFGMFPRSDWNNQMKADDGGYELFQKFSPDYELNHEYDMLI